MPQHPSPTEGSAQLFLRGLWKGESLSWKGENSSWACQGGFRQFQATSAHPRAQCQTCHLWSSPIQLMTSLLCPDNPLLLPKAINSTFISSRFKLRDWPAAFQVSNSSSKACF